MLCSLSIINLGYIMRFLVLFFLTCQSLMASSSSPSSEDFSWERVASRVAEIKSILDGRICYNKILKGAFDESSISSEEFYNQYPVQRTAAFRDLLLDAIEQDMKLLEKTLLITKSAGDKKTRYEFLFLAMDIDITYKFLSLQLPKTKEESAHEAPYLRGFNEYSFYKEMRDIVLSQLPDSVLFVLDAMQVELLSSRHDGSKDN